MKLMCPCSYRIAIVPILFLSGGRPKHVLSFEVKCVFLMHFHAFGWWFAIANSWFLVRKKMPAGFPKFISKKHVLHQANWLNPEFFLKHSGEQMSTRQIFLERVSWDMRVRLKLSKFFWTCKLRVGMNWESGVKGCTQDGLFRLNIWGCCCCCCCFFFRLPSPTSSRDRRFVSPLFFVVVKFN